MRSFRRGQYMPWEVEGEREQAKKTDAVLRSGVEHLLVG